MANINLTQAEGFWPFGALRRTNQYVSAAACYPGDLVIMTSAGQVQPCAANSASAIGVCLSYASASGQSVTVSDDPTQFYCGVAAAGTAVNGQTDIGNTLTIVATAGSTAYKVSRQTLDLSTLSTSTQLLQLVGVDGTIGNTDASGDTYTKFIFRINKTQFDYVTGSVGI